ncbi:E3 ubiquitin-protein ligase RFI2 [Brassica rapa]|uniref:E3 ubiquitin-protein ligase RFI2 n=1 Tax=Brassica campestris TaxID=3711 RepID=UPI0004F1B22F|nr:E3 ubiquitin-protein ligase RFI2 [Brassica rapa]
MGLGNKLNKFNFGDTDLAHEGGAADGGDPRDEGDGFGSAACSICLDTVAKDGDRAWANLQCGHLFHLDCIGSAFNAKGVMQCPNCRKIEKGQWLYANGCRSHPEFNVEDWFHEDEFFDIGGYSEVAFGVHWCPFGSSARLPSFDDAEFSPSSYHDLFSQQGYFTEPAAPTAGHPCPYVTYIGPVHSSSSSTGGVSESSTFTWNTGSSVSNEVPAPYGFPVDPHYHGWDYPSPPPPPQQHFSLSVPNVGSPTQPTPPPAAARTSRANGPRPPQFMRPSYHGQTHSSSGRAGSSVAPPFPGSNARTRDRTQALQAYYQQSTAQSHQQPDSPVVSRGPVFPSGRRPSRGSASSSSDQAGGSGFLRFNIWEREPYMPLQQAYPVNQMDREPSIWTSSYNEGAGSFLQRHGGGGGSS